MYSFNHRGCAIASEFETGTHACPVICTRPTQTDRGTNAVFTGTMPFSPGPALTGRIPNMGSGQILLVNINPAQLQAACVPSTTGLSFQLFGPADGGSPLPGSYAINGTVNPGAAAVLLQTTALPALGLGGTVTLSSLSPVTATFDISGFSRDAGGRLEGSFTATSCP